MRTLLLMLALLLGSMTALASPNTTIRLAYSDVESFPFQMGNGSSIASPPGLSVDVINRAARDLGINVEYIRLPGKRVLHYIKNNQVDGGFLFSYNSQRALYADYPMKDQSVDPLLRIATLEYYFYRLTDQSFDWDGEQITPKQNTPVGAHNGFSIVKQLQQQKIDTYEVLSTEQLFKMLSKRRVAAIAIQSSMANSYIQQKHLTNVERVEPAISSKDYYLIFSHKFTQEHSELVHKLWQHIGTVRDEVFTSNMNRYIAKAP
jgi:polar amino acid transport system substrate-binding protein